MNQSALKALARDNLTLLVAMGATTVLGLRTLAIAGGDISVAGTLLGAVPGPVILGETAMSLLPMLPLLLSAAGIVVVWPERAVRINIWTGLWAAAVLAAFLSPPSQVAACVFVAWHVFHKRPVVQPERRTKPFASACVGVATVLALLLTIWSQPVPLTLERLTTGSTQVIGYPLKSGDGWLTAMTLDNRLVQLPLATVTERTPCREHAGDLGQALGGRSVVGWLSLLKDSPTC